MRDAYAEPPHFHVERMEGETDTAVAPDTINAPDARRTPVRIAHADVWRFRDGRMAELRAFMVPEPG